MKNLQITDSELSLLTDLVGRILADPPYLMEAGGFYLPGKKTINLEDVDFDLIRDVYDKLQLADE